MPQPNWTNILRQYRQSNPKGKGRLDLHDVRKDTPFDAGYCPFPEEIDYANPKRNQSEDLFIYGLNTGEKSTIEVYFKRRPLETSNRFDLAKDQVEVKLKLEDGKGNLFWMDEKSVVDFSANEYRCAGFAYEAIQANKIGRIKFRGYLQKNNETDKLYYVQIRFLCLYFSKLYDHQRLFDDNLLAKQLNDSKLNTETLEDLLEDKVEQFCQIKGTFKVESDEENELFFMATVGRRFLPAKELPPRNVVKICGFDQDGTGFQIGFVAQGNESSYYYGFLSRRGENFKLINRSITLSKEDFRKMVTTNTKNQLELIFDGKAFRLEIFPHKDNFRLIKLNDIEGMCFVEEQLFDQTEKSRAIARLCGNEFTHNLVVPLGEDMARVVELTGGKGASLAQLCHLSKDSEWFVPKAIVVTTSAYRVQTDGMDYFENKKEHLEREVMARHNVEKECDQMQTWFSAQPLDREISMQVEEQMKIEFGPDWQAKLFAVRSSAANEDSSEMSAAGQMTTYLGVRGMANLNAAVVKCWASQFGFVPVEYKRGYGQALNSPMAVVIQEMVDCDSAGVIFTANPTDGDERILTVTSNFGLGESVVSASADPDTFQLAVEIKANSYETERQIESISGKTLGKKSLVTRLNKEVEIDKNLESGVLNEQIVDGTQQQSLDNYDVIRLGNIALKIQQHYGNPRDIEWGLKDGQIHIFQSRPITNLDSTFTNYELMHEMDTPHLCESEIYTRDHWGEIFPGSISWIGSFFLLNEFQATRDQIKQGNINFNDYNPYRPFMGFIFNQVMFNLKNDLIQSLLNQYPESDLIAAVVLAFFGHHITEPDVLESFRASRERLKPSAKQKMKMIGMVWGMLFSSHKKIPQLKREIIDNNRGDIAGPMARIAMPEKIPFMLRQVSVNFEDSQYHNATTMGSILKSMFLMKMLKNENTEAMEHDHNLLLSHCNDVVSAEIPNMLREIASVIEDKQAFASLTDQEAIQVLRSKDDKESKAAEMFAQFIQKHGHRGHRESDPLYLPMKRNPTPCVQVIKSLLKSNSNLEPKPHKSIDQIMSELKTPLSSFKKFLIKKWFLPWCRDAVGYRENTKSIMMMHQNQIREAMWQIAQDMHSKAIIPEIELFFYLKLNEVVLLIDGSQSPLLLWKAKQRRRLFGKMDILKFDEFIKGFRMQPRVAMKEIIQIDGQSLALKGTAVTVGEVKARVCVAETIEEAANVQQGDILLTYSTDIGWSPYFPLISGIVTEIGGTISHGAVIAREYGIPCLIAVQNVCGHFKTGDIAFLDTKTASIIKVKE